MSALTKSQLIAILGGSFGYVSRIREMVQARTNVSTIITLLDRLLTDEERRLLMAGV